MDLAGRSRTIDPDKIFETCEEYDKKKAEHERKLSEPQGFKDEKAKKDSEGRVQLAKRHCWNSFLL